MVVKVKEEDDKNRQVKKKTNLKNNIYEDKEM